MPGGRSASASSALLTSTMRAGGTGPVEQDEAPTAKSGREESVGPDRRSLLVPARRAGSRRASANAVEQFQAFACPNASSIPEQWVETVMISRFGGAVSSVSSLARQLPESPPCGYI